MAINYCRCRSGIPARKCCLGITGKYRKRGFTYPQRNPTDYAHPACYLGITKDCGTKISREHHMTEAILERIASKNNIATGYHWMPEQGLSLPTNALASNILCKDHNERLAPLDERAIILFDFIRQAQENSGEAPTLVINGHDIERWISQRAAAYIISGNASLNGKRVSSDLLDIEVVSNAIVHNIWPPGAGLYMTTLPPSGFAEGTEFAPMFEMDFGSAEPNRIFGSRVTLAGLPLAVVWSLPQNSILVNMGLGTHRPRNIELKNSTRSFEIDISWDNSQNVSGKVILDQEPWNRGPPPKVDPEAILKAYHRKLR